MSAPAATTSAPRSSGTSLSTRLVLLSVGVALVAAVLSGLAAARVVISIENTAQQTQGQPLTVKERRTEVRELLGGRRISRAVLTSVGVGLLVGLVAGATTARAMTRPLRRAAAAARELGAGRRDIQVPTDGPPEVADVAAGLNTLAAALATSEDRQRRFLLSVSHELRTPLTAIRGFAESIADGVVAGPDAQSAGQVILAESRRLDRLVSDLLDLARLGADSFRLDLADVDTGRVFAEAVEVWTARGAERGVQVRAERSGVPGVVRADPTRLRQVVDGLAENALRMTPTGGVVVLALHGPATFQVRDSGPGLSAADRAVAFEPGALGERYRDERPVGVGIGLSLAHGLVARMGGRLSVDVAPEGGACFTATLPV